MYPEVNFRSGWRNRPQNWKAKCKEYTIESFCKTDKLPGRDRAAWIQSDRTPHKIVAEPMKPTDRITESQMDTKKTVTDYSTLMNTATTTLVPIAEQTKVKFGSTLRRSGILFETDIPSPNYGQIDKIRHAPNNSCRKCGSRTRCGQWCIPFTFMEKENWAIVRTKAPNNDEAIDFRHRSYCAHRPHARLTSPYLVQRSQQFGSGCTIGNHVYPLFHPRHFPLRVENHALAHTVSRNIFKEKPCRGKIKHNIKELPPEDTKY